MIRCNHQLYKVNYASSTIVTPQTPSPKEIEDLVDSYVDCWATGKGGFNIPSMAGIENPRIILTNNLGPCEAQFLVFATQQDGKWIWRYQIHTFPYSLVTYLPIILTRSFKAQAINFDHRVLWSWIAQIFLDPRNQNTVQERELIGAIELLMRLNFAALKQPPLSDEVSKLNRVIDVVVDYHVIEIVSNSLMLATVLSYPVLEGLLKSKCSAYVDMDSNVTSTFTLSFRSNPFQVGEKVSSLKTLLTLFEEKVAGATTTSLLNRFKSEVERIFNPITSVYDLIYNWRNNMLHGSNMRQSTFGVVMNLIYLLLLDTAVTTYQALASSFSNRPQMLGYSDPWRFYPPALF